MVMLQRRGYKKSHDFEMSLIQRIALTLYAWWLKTRIAFCFFWVVLFEGLWIIMNTASLDAVHFLIEGSFGFFHSMYILSSDDS